MNRRQLIGTIGHSSGVESRVAESSGLMVGDLLQRSSVVCVAVALFCACGRNSKVKADPAHPVAGIGSPAPDFSLEGTDGRRHTLAEFAGSKVLAIVFDCNHCPESHLYESRIQKLYTDYREKGVAVIAVNPFSPERVNEADLMFSDLNESLLDMQTRAGDRRLQYPYLYDGASQSLTAKLGALATPQVFVFDHSRRLCYEGRIDDSAIAARAKTHETRDAIDALLAGRNVAVTTTPVSGCAVRWNKVSQPEDKRNVTVEMTTPEILKKLRGNGTGKLLLVNFWATWCGPCVAEFPELENTYRMYRDRGFEMVTVSEDVPGAKNDVLSFLKRNRATTVNYLFDTDDTAAVQDQFDPQMSGAVPYTLLFSPAGEVLYQEQGEITMPNLRRHILANLPDDQDHKGQQAYWAQTIRP
jgi:thiol-disulfide isomerase/thioredoxin